MTSECLLSGLPLMTEFNYEAIFESSKNSLMTQYGFDEKTAIELAFQAVEYAKSAADGLGFDRELLKNLLDQPKASSSPLP